MSKGKKRPQEAAAQGAVARANRPAIGGEWRFLWPILALGAVYFLLTSLTTGSTIKAATLAVTVAAILVILLRGGTLWQRVTLSGAALALFVLLNGISTLYAVSGKFALSEFLKMLFAFSLFVLILAFEKGGVEELGRRSAAILTVGAALSSVLSIDAISTQILGNLFVNFMSLFSGDYMGITGIEAGVRMTSIMGNPNIYAGCVGIGVLLSLGLANTAPGRGERMLHRACLSINALGFLLAFSMGASGTIAAAFLVYLLFETKQRRAGLLVLMVETLVITLCAAFPIYLTSFGEWSGVQPVPILCMLAAAAGLCALDELAGRRLTGALLGREKIVFALLGVVLAAAVGFAALALNWTGGITLAGGESLRRSDYPQPGSYTMDVQSDGEILVMIESQNRQDTMMHTSTLLYQGAAQGAAFTVPEDSMVVYFNFITGESPVSLDGVSYQGENGTGSIKLGYKLLPGFIANRMQGLFANQNAIQRVVFFEDGMKLFARNPLIGQGMGSFENGVASVQTFYYTTKYTHNHYIQVLLEIGVVGLCSFLAVLGLCAAAIFKSRRRENASPLTATLGAILVFMATHGAVEVVFSANFYLPMAFGVFALISLCCGQSLWMVPVKKKKTALWGWGGVAALMGVYGVLLSCNMYAQSLFAQPSFSRMVSAIQLDRFEWQDPMISFVINAYGQQQRDQPLMIQAEKYAQRLEQVNSNIIPYYLAQAYFAGGEMERAFTMLEKYVSYVAADPNTWQQAFLLVMNNADDSQTCRQGIIKLYQMLQDWNTENMGTITLDPTIQIFVDYMMEEI